MRFRLCVKVVKQRPIWQTSWPIAMQSTPPETATNQGAERRPAGGEPAPAGSDESRRAHDAALPREIGGRAGPDPTRFGDWEKNGRCIDF
jgi:hypothetical protein